MNPNKLSIEEKKAMRERYGSWAWRMLAVLTLLLTFTTAKAQLINPKYYPTLSVKNYNFYPNGSLLVPAPSPGGERLFYVPIFIYNEVQYRNLNYNVRDAQFIADSLFNANIGGQRLEPLRSFEFQLVYFTQAMELDTASNHGSPISMVGPGKTSEIDTALARHFYVRYSDVPDPGNDPNGQNQFRHRIRIAAASEVPMDSSITQDTSGILLWLRFKVIPGPVNSGLLQLDSIRFNDHYGDSLINPLTYRRGNMGGDAGNKGQGNVIITPQPSFDLRPLSLLTSNDNKNFELTTDLVYDPSIPGALPPKQALQIRNGQSNSRLTNVKIVTDEPWLLVSSTPAGGLPDLFIRSIDYTSSTGSDEKDLWISANPAGLQPGIYYGTVTLTSDGASNSPARIRVKFIIRRNPDEPTPGGTGIRMTLTNSCTPACSRTLVFGTGTGASPAIDPLYGETIFDANSKTQADTNILARERCFAYFEPLDKTVDPAYADPAFLGTLRDIRSNQTDTTLLYKVVFSAGDPLCYPVTVCVDPSDFPAGGRIIARDILNGSIFSVDLRQGTEVGNSRCFVIRDPKITSFIIEYTPGTIGTVPTFVKNGWNLISLPVLPPDNRASVIFPNAAGTPFHYRASVGWVPTTTLEFGRGYMIKYGNFVGNDNLVAGVRLKQISNVRVDAGWNTIGALSVPTNVCGIFFTGLTPQAPTPLQESEVYEYVTGRGYRQVAFMTPGVGYFVKTSTEGYYNLNVCGGKVSATAADAVTGELSEVTIRDAAQNGQELYFGNVQTSFNEKSFELPPTVHELDARFVSNSGYVSFNKQSYTVSIKTQNYPVALNFSKVQGDVEVRDLMGNLIATATNGSNVIIRDKSVKQVVISYKGAGTVATPSGYALEQNYPNPFNPSTSIFYSIPVDGNVSIVVTNQLGQVVKTVFEGFATAGRHEVKFDGAGLASGTYYYTMKSGSFTQSAKMTLSK